MTDGPLIAALQPVPLLLRTSQRVAQANNLLLCCLINMSRSEDGGGVRSWAHMRYARRAKFVQVNILDLDYSTRRDPLNKDLLRSWTLYRRCSTVRW
jgi:hypothetical protein